MPVSGRLEELLFSGAQLVLIRPLEPGLDRSVLIVEMVHVRHQVLDHVHVGQGIDLGNLVACLDFTAEEKENRMTTLGLFANLHLAVNLILARSYLIQAKVLMPPMFMAQDPQIPSRHERLKVTVGSISFLILIKASSTIGPHEFKSTSYSCILGLSPEQQKKL